MGWLIGYYMERGHKPEEIISLSRDERQIYLAIAELNKQKQKEELEASIINAMICFHNMIHDK